MTPSELRTMEEEMNFYWPYFDLENGLLYDEDKRRVFPEAPRFASAIDAEDWLSDQDIRGNVRG